MRITTDNARMLPLIRLAIILTALIAISASADAQSGQLRLLSIDTSSTGGQTSLQLHFSATAPTPSIFVVQHPIRLAIDLPNTTLALRDNTPDIARGPIQGVVSAAADGKTRIVVKLDRMIPHQLRRAGNNLIVHFGNEVHEPASVQRTTYSRPARPVASDHEQPDSITKVDFRRGSQGTGKVDISLNTSDIQYQSDKQNGRVIVRLPGIHLPGRLARRYDVTDFATPVKTVDVMSRDGGTRIVVTPDRNARFKYQVFQADDHLYIELHPRTRPTQAHQTNTQPEYTGKPISLSLQHAKINSVLQTIANVAGVNLVVSDKVSGNITLQLKNIPWDQALQVILDAKHLGMTREGNVIMVAPLNELAKLSQAKAKARKANRELAPLHSEIIQINYARASEIAQILRSEQAASNTQISSVAPTANGDNINPLTARGPSLLSARGHVTVDKRTNSLLVTDTDEKLAQIRALIHKLDIPVRQVLIQTRIVVANREFSRNLGISQSASGDSSRLSNPIDVIHSGYSIALPAAEATSVLSTSIISDTFNLNLQLSAMESDNEGEIISSPRVITADGQEANIEQGREIPYQEGSENSNAGTSVTFKKAVLSLNVTPHITPNQQVIMGLKVTQDTVGDYVPTAEGGRVPSINTRSLKTRVLVGDGDTVVLGGIFERTKRHKTDSVPFLSKIPLLGVLFKGTQRQDNKRELLIFVTPRILHNNTNLQQTAHSSRN